MDYCTTERGDARHSDWSTERVDALKRMWAEGLSAGQIARRIGAVSRSAVLGKIFRLGLPGRHTATRMQPAERKPKARDQRINRHLDFRRQPSRILMHAGAPVIDPTGFVAKAMPPAEPQPVLSHADVPLHQRRSFADLEECHCKWPIGDPQRADFAFCGGQRVPGQPYCEGHARLAFQERPARPKPVYAPLPSSRKRAYHDGQKFVRVSDFLEV